MILKIKPFQLLLIIVLKNKKNLEVNVDHNIDEFREGDEAILVLKDSNVLDDEGF